jgi:acyl-CoA thioester hydrolase
MADQELLSNFPVRVEFPIAWGDMDAFQHVNNTRYFRFFEDARIAYFERTGLIEDSGLPGGIGPILAETSCRFKYPVTYPDTMHVGARVVSLGQDRFEMVYRVVSESAQRVAAEGKALVVSFDYAAGEKAPLPDEWVEHVENIEGRSFDRGEFSGDSS